jgi:hypothetical protein
MCTIINYPGKVVQLDVYNHYTKNYGNDTEWAIICDGDEYILPKQDWSLRDFLNKYEDVHAIGINWMMFGSSFHNSIQEGFLIDKYRYCEGIKNSHIKTICKPRNVIDWPNPHYPNLINNSIFIDPKRNNINGPFNDNSTNDIIQINHYSIKSLEDIVRKHHRGFPDHFFRTEIPHDIDLKEHSSHHTIYNNVIDNLICDKYLPHIISIYNEIYE